MYENIFTFIFLTTPLLSICDLGLCVTVFVENLVTICEAITVRTLYKGALEVFSQEVCVSLREADLA